MKAVIFDMDGTMFDSEKIWRDMWLNLPLEFGYEKDPTLGVDMCGTSGQKMRDVAKAHFPEVDPELFVQRGLLRYRERIASKQPEEMTGLRELLSHLKNKGYKLAIASGSEQETIELNLRRAGLSDYFQAMVSGHEVPKGKPAPDIMLEAARRMECEPAECWVIEDGENGIRSAVAAGCKAIMIPDATEPEKEMYEICFGVYNTLLDVISVIK